MRAATNATALPAVMFISCSAAPPPARTRFVTALWASVRRLRNFREELSRAVGERLGYEATDAAKAFAQDVKIAFSIGHVNGFKYAVREEFEKHPRPRPQPEFFSLLCLWVLAASRMGADERYPTSEY